MPQTGHERPRRTRAPVTKDPTPNHPDQSQAPVRSSATALFGALRKAGVDEEAAYTAAREMEFVADRSVAARIETHMDVFGARMETANAQLLVQFQAALQGAVRDLRAEFKADLAEVKADLTEVKADLTEVKANLATVTADLAALKREVRLIWGCLSLLVATLTAVLIRLFAA